MNFFYSRSFCLFAWLLALVTLAGCGGATDGATGGSLPGSDTDPGPQPTSSLPTVGTAKRLESFDGDVSLLRFALDGRSASTVYVSWNQGDGEESNLYITRFVEQNGFWDVLPVRLNEVGADVAGAGEMVVDHKGSVAVVWPEWVEGRRVLKGRYHAFSQAGWRAAETLGGDSRGDAGQPAMVVEPGSRYILAVWPQTGGVLGRLWANRYNIDPGSGWEVATPIDVGGGEVETVLLMVDGQDTTTAIWTQHDGVRYNLWARRHDSGNGWEAVAEKLDSEDLGDVSSPLAVLDADGNMTVVWLQHDGASDNLWAIRHERGGWTNAQKIGVAPGVADPHLVVDSLGVVTVAWVQQAGSWGGIWTRRYLDGRWADAVKVSSVANAVAQLALLTVDSDHNVVAVWRERNRGYQNLWSARYAPESGWGVPGEIENLNNGDAGTPVGGVSAGGDITLVWRHRHEGGDHLVSSRYRVASDRWGQVVKVELATQAGGQDPALVVDDEGIATVVWRQAAANGLHDLWGNRF